MAIGPTEVSFKTCAGCEHLVWHGDVPRGCSTATMWCMHPGRPTGTRGRFYTRLDCNGQPETPDWCPVT